MRNMRVIVVVEVEVVGRGRVEVVRRDEQP
jgi:hypothetical protein